MSPIDYVKLSITLWTVQHVLILCPNIVSVRLFFFFSCEVFVQLSAL